MGRISFTLMDLQQISYRLQGKGKLKFRYVFINNNKGRRPQRIKHIRGGSSSTGEANITNDAKFIDLHLTRSKERPGLFMNFPVNPCTYSTKGVSKGEELVLLSADLFQDNS